MRWGLRGSGRSLVGRSGDRGVAEAIWPGSEWTGWSTDACAEIDAGGAERDRQESGNRSLGMMRRWAIAAEKDKGEREPEAKTSRRPLFPPPKMEPNLKSATLYPPERMIGFRMHERKKGK